MRLHLLVLLAALLLSGCLTAQPSVQRDATVIVPPFPAVQIAPPTLEYKPPVVIVPAPAQ